MGFPAWLHGLAIASLVAGLACAALIAADEARRPQSMWIMDLVWPLCALFGSVLWLGLYWRWGRGPPRGSGMAGMPMGGMAMEAAPMNTASMAVSSAKAASHCGAGCALGDMLAEGLAFAVPGLAVAFGWGWLFTDRMFAVWGLDLVLAFEFGIAFQYFTLDPARTPSVARRIVRALQSDAATIAAWQVGMYGFMAFAQLGWLTPLYGRPAPVNSPEFWLVMQLAMLCGFVTSYPVNWLLVRLGIKEAM
jgi:hypothetical protein